MIKMINSIKQKGVTLIEMGFVIAIMSAIVLIAVNYSMNYSAQVQANKAGMDMKEILNAAILYKENPANSGDWPTIGELDQYIPNISSQTASPWGTAYSVSKFNNDQSFKVSVDTHKLSSAIQVKNLLPNGNCEDPSDTGKSPACGTTGFTGAYGTISESAINNNSTYIISTVSPGGQVPYPDACKDDPGNAHIFAALSSVDSGTYGKPMEGVYIDTTQTDSAGWYVHVYEALPDESSLIEDPKNSNNNTNNIVISVITYCGTGS